MLSQIPDGSSRFVKCSACGHSAPEVFWFCPSCGQPLTNANPIVATAEEPPQQARSSKRLLGFLATFGLFLVLLNAYAFWIEPNRVVEERFRVPIPGLPTGLEGFTIVHLSDLHIVSEGRREKVAVRIANRADADVVVVTGDFAGGTGGDIRELAEQACVRVLGRLKSRHGVFGALGTWDLMPMLDKLRRAEMALLMDRSTTFVSKGNLVTIAGIRHDTMDLRRALSGTPRNSLKIVICDHLNPPLEHELPRAGVALCLTGARHGGQIRIPLIDKFYGPEYRIGARWIGTTWHYANRGLGVTRLAARFLCPPEVAVITLTRSRVRESHQR